MRVLIVDDSIVFRSQIKAALTGVSAIEVVGTASNGKIALAKIEQATVDLITLDFEMPEMGGIETLRELRGRGFKTRVIVFASPSAQDAGRALEAMRLGADDIVLKPSGASHSLETAADSIRAELVPKILQFAASREKKEVAANARLAGQDAPSIAEEKASWPTISLEAWGPPQVVLIGSSTGGPVALEKLLKGVQAPFCCPILVAQHMPAVFTASMAQRLALATGLEAREARQMESPIANTIYLAPGDYHMRVVISGDGAKLALDQGPRRNSVRPSVDALFESAAEVFGDRALGVVLTGMGEDGLLGAKAIKRGGGAMLIQDKESCVVFGMPGAVFEAGAFDRMGNLESLSSLLGSLVAPGQRPGKLR